MGISQLTCISSRPGSWCSPERQYSEGIKLNVCGHTLSHKPHSMVTKTNYDDRGQMNYGIFSRAKGFLGDSNWQN